MEKQVYVALFLKYKALSHTQNMSFYFLHLALALKYLSLWFFLLLTVMVLKINSLLSVPQFSNLKNRFNNPIS